MNRLPEDRRVIHGRTFSESWSPGRWDPIEAHRSPVPFAERVGGVLLATGIGIVLTLLLVHELAGGVA
jgi:hypothetical protein